MANAGVPVITTPENPSPPPPDDKSVIDAPLQFAIPYESMYDISTEGVWEETDDGWRVWRVRIVCPGALHVNLGLANVVLPNAVVLYIYNEDDTSSVRTFTERDNKPHGELWTPIVMGDSIMLELNVPPSIVSLESIQLTIQSINSGFRSIGGNDSLNKRSGSCNVDVVCSEGDDWSAEVSAVAAYSQGGSLFCTGALINNALQDGTPYFLTAHHCGINSDAEARSLVVYWNFETSSCGKEQPDGDLSIFQTGASFRAGHATTDFSLLELDQRPDEQWGIHYAGWDRSGSPANAAIAIHHPSGDEKRISFENDPITFTSYSQNTPFSTGSHIRVEDWDLGTTERGSSGSPLFDPNHRIIGQLHGGYAACGNDLPDWYGRFSMSWEGGGQASRRLKDWLDPTMTGATTVDTVRILDGGGGGNGVGPTPTTKAPSSMSSAAPVASPPDDVIDKGCEVNVLWLFCIIGDVLKAIVDWIVGIF